MNALLAAAVGSFLALAGTIGGVAAYQGSPHGVSQDSLYSYADK